MKHAPGNTTRHDWIWLASQSPRRRELLAQVGVEARLLLAEADEDAESLEAERAGEAPQDYVERVTRAKLDAAIARLRSRGLEPAPILCADTTVALGRRIHAKPADAADAARMLRALSGRTHRVITAVALAVPSNTARGWRRTAATSVSHVRFAPLDAARIEAYVASGEPFGKAGGYGIQGRAAAFVAHVDGSYTGIMGLPLYETSALLRRARCKTS